MYMSDYTLIQIENDYTENDGRGLMVTLCYDESDVGEFAGYDMELVRIVDEGQMISDGRIVDINHRCMVGYTSQNPEYMFDVEDEYMTKRNIGIVRDYYEIEFPGADVIVDVAPW